MKLPVYLIDIGTIIYPEDDDYEKYKKYYDGQYGYYSYDKSYEFSMKKAIRIAEAFVSKYHYSYATVRKREIESSLFLSDNSKEEVSIKKLHKLKPKKEKMDTKGMVFNIANLGNRERNTIVENFMIID